jgi:hypothetical protein
MPSKLHNLFRTLAWSDFPRANKPAPGPGEFVHGAQCKTDIVPSGFALDKVGSLYRIRDSIDVKIEYRRNESWVANWVFKESKSFQDDLLNHEQGHYNIAALFGRDFFLALMRLKPKTYANAAAASTKPRVTSR